MSKRDPNDQPDPFDDLLFDDPLEKPLDQIANVSLDEIEDEVDPERAQWRKTRAPLSIGQVIGGCFQVVLIALLSLAIFLLIGFGTIFAAQRLGVVPPRGAADTTAVVALPTPVAASGEQPTAAPAEPTAVPTALPSATPDTSCATAPAWWNSQQIRDNYVYFTQQALEEARTSDRISALLEQMRIRRNFVANFGAAPCLSEALDALVRGFDATIESARALNAGDQPALRQQQAAASGAFAQLTVALWTFGANADPLAPPILGVARGSGSACGAQGWYSAVQPHLDAFMTAANAIDPATTAADTARAQLDTMSAERASIAALETPACATQPQTTLLAALDSLTQSIQQRLAGTTDSALPEYTRQNTIFNAWVQWLGIS